MKLLCKIFGHKWIPDNVDIYANIPIGAECKRCHKRTQCVCFEKDYQYQCLLEMIREDVKNAKEYILDMLY